MDRTADLDSALGFVIGRIAELAEQSGEPLTDEQRLLLNYLPSEQATNWDPEFTVLVPRNINLEQVCALGKAAYLHDCQINPSSPDWEFALAVFTLNKHRMGGLLQLAGMRLKLRRPPWDRLRLISIALVPLVAVTLLVWNADGPWILSVTIGSACVACMVFLFFSSKRIEKQRLKEYIEKCRVASSFAAALPR